MNVSMEKNKYNDYGVKVGFVFAYFLFTTILYLLLSGVSKSDQFRYYNIMIFSSGISYLGLLLKEIYK